MTDLCATTIDGVQDAPDPTGSGRPAPVSVPDPTRPHPFVEQLALVCAAHPDVVALRDETDRELTYAELALIGGAGLGTGTTPVAVMGSSTAALAAATAVLCSGRPLVLLDAELPGDRVRHILTSSGADPVLVDPAAGSRPGGRALTGTDREVVVVDEAWLTSVLERGAGFGPVDGTAAECPASIVFTSGSTGAPKGVVLSHAVVTNGAATSRVEFGLRPGDRCALVLPPAYAAGQEVLAMSLLSGCTVVSRDLRTSSLRGVGAWLRENAVTTLHCTPSLLRHLSGALGQEQVPGVRLLTTCGEAIHSRDVLAAATWLPHATYANYLGSSETQHISFFHADPHDPASLPDGPIPAGRPAPTKTVTVHDDDGVELPTGDTGRLRITSAHLASGYWGDPDGTAAVFQVSTRLAGAPRTFLTSDRGRLDETGALELRGRGDDAVKIRGYLVEPAEVEAALRRLDEVGDAAVLADHDGGEPRLVGYVVPAAGQRRISAAQLRLALLEQLPTWMVPPVFIHLTALPRTERGKLDRAALPSAPPRSDDTVPADQWESLVAGVWRRVLGLDAIGRDEDFFALGGDSLAVEEVLAALGERGITLHSSDIGTASTLAGFAVTVRRAHRAPEPAGAPEVAGLAAEGTHDRRIQARFRTGGDGIPVVCFGGAGGPAYLFAELAHTLDPAHPVSAFQVRGYEGRALPDWSVRAAARRYVRHIVEQHPTGPVALVGHSLGGLFALEAAHQLTALGREVVHLTILDTVLPGSLAASTGTTAPEVRIPGGRRQSRAELWRTRWELLGAGWYPYRPATRDQVFFQHGLRLTERYRPERWSGRTEVFLTPDNIDDRRWWDTVLDDHTLTEMECDHLAILRTPYVEAIVASIETGLRAAR